MSKSFSDFEIWWHHEGSGITPYKGEDTEQFAKRIANISWANGEYCEKNKFIRRSTQTAESPRPPKHILDNPY